MERNNEKNAASINTLSTVLYHTLQGKKVPYTDVVQKAKQLFPIILPDMIASPDHNTIVKEVVNRYVCEVGIQTYDPEFIDLERESKYWLYKDKECIRHPFFDRYKLYLSNDGFEPKIIKNIELSCEQILARCANPKTSAPTEKKSNKINNINKIKDIRKIININNINKIKDIRKIININKFHHLMHKE